MSILPLDTAPAPAIEAGGLTRRYGSTLALRGVDLALGLGERVVLLGPNGAGKTTLIRILGLSLSPTAGWLRVQGIPTAQDPTGVRRQVGMVGQRPGLYEDLTPRENLRFFGRLYGLDRNEARVAEVLDEVEVGRSTDRPVRTLSRGLQQRVALARAILHRPPVLLMDEPEAGLDRAAQTWLAGLVQGWAQLGRSVLFATHRLDWAAQAAERALVLRDGLLRCEVRVMDGDEPALGRAYEAALQEST